MKTSAAKINAGISTLTGIFNIVFAGNGKQD